jgi:8-oxo-dGTP pyrophosphatase MutT (NUDIX family)
MKQRKATKFAKKGKPVRQVAALPYRRAVSGDIELLVLTSRTTRRFILPKGWPMKGKAGHEAAAKEAEQEAGVLGDVAREPIGSYRYWKRMRTAFVPVTVTVYPLAVTAELPDWRERKQRLKQWVPREEAIRLIDEPELVSLIAQFPG